MANSYDADYDCRAQQFAQFVGAVIWALVYSVVVVPLDETAAAGVAVIADSRNDAKTAPNRAVGGAVLGPCCAGVQAHNDELNCAGYPLTTHATEGSNDICPRILADANNERLQVCRVGFVFGACLAPE